ncbi:MAG: hypothetical protein R3B72_39220 [Polyangiaceae bacterium]
MSALVQALERLNQLVAAAVARAQEAMPEGDRYRGLYVNEVEVERLLARPVGEVPFSAGRLAGDSLPASIVSRFQLSPFDADVLVLALAQEVDLRYERLFGYLHDDVTRRQPTVGLALMLLCGTPEERIVARRSFDPDGPLLRHHLVELSKEGTSELSRSLRLDRALLGHLLGQQGLDEELAPYAELVQAPMAADGGALDLLPLQTGERPRLERLLERVQDAERRSPVTLRLAGMSSPRAYAAAIARALGAPLVVAQSADPRVVPRLALDAALRGAVLFVDRAVAAAPAWGRVHAPCFLLAGAGFAPSLGGERVTLDEPKSSERRRWWQSCLAAQGLRAEEEDVALVSGRFRIGLDAIERATAQLAADTGLVTQQHPAQVGHDRRSGAL